MTETIQWKPYDPGWLIELAKDQSPEETWLPEALAACTKAWQVNEVSIDFIHPVEGKFETNIAFRSPTGGMVILDILEPNIVGGVEFLFDPPLTCPCGYVFEVSATVSHSWIAVANLRYQEFRRNLIELPTLTLDREKNKLAIRNLVRRGRELKEKIYQCPKCGRIMWLKPGEKSLHIFAPENTIDIEASPKSHKFPPIPINFP